MTQTRPASGKVDVMVAEDGDAAQAAHKPAKKKADGLADVLAMIAAMPEDDCEMAMRFHSIVERIAPSLTPRLWYGMPAYARDGKVLCFFQAASKFKTRYATFGFEEIARLDDGAMWPTSYALTELGDAEEERIVELLTKAMG